MKRMVILPGSWAASERRRALAATLPLDFLDTTFTTSDCFLEQVWGIWGNGLALAGFSQRLAALSGAMKNHPTSFPDSYGAISSFLSFIDRFLGSVRLDCCLDGSLDCSDVEAVVLECIVAYEKLLADKGLVDPGRAFQILSSFDVFVDDTKVVCEGVELTASQKEFFASQTHVELADCFSVENSAQFLGEGGGISFILPAGRYAEPHLILDALTPRLRKGRAAVLTRRPLELFEAVSSCLEECGASCFVKGIRRFSETQVGKAFFCVSNIVRSGELQRDAVLDYIFNPVSLTPLTWAYSFAAYVRGDRIIEKEVVLGELRELSKAFACFEELVIDPDADVLLGHLEDLVVSLSGMEEAVLEEQRVAFDTMRAVFSSARLFGIDAAGCEKILAQATLEVSYKAGTGACEVLILDWRDVASLAPSSCATVVACDMANADWPTEANRIELLGEECLYVDAPGGLPCVGELFNLARTASSDAFFIEWRQYDEDASPMRPVAIVDDLWYTLQNAEYEAASDAHILQRSEGEIYENLTLGLKPLSSTDTFCAHGASRIKGAFSGIRLSAAQMEAYASCPYAWFAQYYLNLDAVDESFDAGREALFCKEVLALFYEQFQDFEAPKVTADLLVTAQQLMSDVVRDCREAHRLCLPEDKRFVANSEEDEFRFAVLESNLVSYLEREADLLPSFSPCYLDYELLVEEPFRYAGFEVTGRIDRIDVNEDGKAVVIKYVSSLTPRHNMRVPDIQGMNSACDSGIQILIQAQLARRCLGLDVVGALYVCYGKNGGLAGAIDQSIASQALSGTAAGLVLDSASVSSFKDVLDSTEKQVEEVLLGLREGDIDPKPVSSGACSHCPVALCPKRR